jgi:hypothetical protein
MQGIERPIRNPPAQEQWKTMKKQCEKTMEQWTVRPARSQGPRSLAATKNPPLSSGGRRLTQMRD